MSHDQLNFKEDILHHFWANLLFAQSSLQTEKGLNVEVLNPGLLNHLDGPDFLDAKIRIGNLIHHGAVEIHRYCRDWFSHGHHKDINYDKVILHVVAQDGPQIPVKTSSGFYPPTVNVIENLPAAFNSIISTNHKSELPCKKLISSISKEVFEIQIEKAQKEYLDQKVDVFFQYFDQHLVPSVAWKRALFITLCDALGVPSNREFIIDSARIIMNRFSGTDILTARNINELVYFLETKFRWKHKGVRYATKPSLRIRQAIQLYSYLEKQPLDYFITSDQNEVWHRILDKCDLKSSKHNHRLFVSFFLPAIYGLGVIVHSLRLKEDAINLWADSSIEVPSSILKRFGIFTTGIELKIKNRIGLVHQFNAYCKPKHCIKCGVLNKAISS